MSVLVACGDDGESMMTADGGPDAGSDAGGGVLDAGPPEDGGPIDAALDDAGSDAGPDDAGPDDAGFDGGPTMGSWPTTPTELPVPAGDVPANVDEVSLVETSGGWGVVLYRSVTAGSQWAVSTRDPADGSWSAPRVLAGRDARLAASGDAAMVIYAECRNERCEDNGGSLFGERYTEAGGWGAAERIDALPSGPTTVDILYTDLVGDGAGNFLVSYNYQSAGSTGFREFADGAWQTPLQLDGSVTEPGYKFVAHAARRYVGMQGTFDQGLVSIVGGGLELGPTASVHFSRYAAYVLGDTVVFSTRSSAALITATWNGEGYTWDEIGNSRRRTQDEAFVVGDGTHVIQPFAWTSGSSGYRFQGEAMIWHDTGEGFDWQHYDVRLPVGVDDHSILSGAVDLPDGALLLFWEGPGGDRNSTVVDWSLLGVRVTFDAFDAPQFSAPVTFGVQRGSQRDMRALQIRAIREGDALLFAWGNLGGPGGYVRATLDAAMPAGIAAGAQREFVRAGRDHGTPGVASFGGRPLITFGDFDGASAWARFRYANGATGPDLESEISADWRQSSSALGLGSDGRGTLIWGRGYLERGLAVAMDISDDGTVGSPAVIPGTLGSAGRSFAFGGGMVAGAATFDIGGNTLPEGLRFLARDAGGSWTTSEIMATAGDWVLGPRIVAFAGGFVAAWIERTGTIEGVLRVAIHDGSSWGSPTTIEPLAYTQLPDGNAISLTANDAAVVLTFVGVESDLQATVLTDLATGFLGPIVMRGDPSRTLTRVDATAGDAGHVVVFRETFTSEVETSVYQARVFTAAGGWLEVLPPFDSLAGVPNRWAMASAPGTFGIAYAGATGVQVATWDGSAWQAAEVLVGDSFGGDEALGLFGSEAGLRVFGTVYGDGDTTYHTSGFHDGTWDAVVSHTLTGNRYAYVEEGQMNATGDVAFEGYGDEGDSRAELVVFRADGTLEQTDIPGWSGGALFGLTPQGYFLLGFDVTDGVAGASSLHVFAGY